MAASTPWAQHAHRAPLVPARAVMVTHPVESILTTTYLRPPSHVHISDTVLRSPARHGGTSVGPLDKGRAMDAYDMPEDGQEPTPSALDVVVSPPPADGYESEGDGEVSVAIADGQALFRSGLSGLLGEDPRIRVMWACGDGAVLSDLCVTSRVDVLVADADLPRLDIVELPRLLSSACPATRILVLGASVDWRVHPMIAAGAAGFLLKDTAPEGLRAAVISVHAGTQVFSSEATAAIMEGRPTLGLTPRESAVLQHVADGASNREIAAAMHIQEKTVRNYMSRLYRKLPSASRSDMTHTALGARAPLAFEANGRLRDVVESEGSR